jgi:hypothetical protein
MQNAGDLTLKRGFSLLSLPPISGGGVLLVFISRDDPLDFQLYFMWIQCEAVHVDAYTASHAAHLV